MLNPKLNEARTLIDLSGICSFQLDDGSSFEHHWEQVLLPNPMTSAVPAAYNDQKEGIDFRDHDGWVFYERYLEVSHSMRNERLVLRFGTVTHFAKVYLNGKLLGEHKGGFLPFEVEVDKLLLSGKNRLTVAVGNKVNHSTLPVGSKTGGNMFGGKLETAQQALRIEMEFWSECGKPVMLTEYGADTVADLHLVTPNIFSEKY